jgi:hypothetical protein
MIAKGKAVPEEKGNKKKGAKTVGELLSIVEANKK